jgi:hypothetical protein
MMQSIFVDTGADAGVSHDNTYRNLELTDYRENQ